MLKLSGPVAFGCAPATRHQGQNAVAPLSSGPQFSGKTDKTKKTNDQDASQPNQGDELVNRIKAVVQMVTDAITVVQKGLVAGVRVIRNLPQWEALLAKADPEGETNTVDRVKSAVDVAIAEFRAGYQNEDDAETRDAANFALYAGVLTRYPGLLSAELADNDKVQTLIEGVSANNTNRSAEETRTALEALATRADDDVPLTAKDVEAALGVPGAGATGEEPPAPGQTA